MNKIKILIASLLTIFLLQGCKVKEYIEVPVEVEKVKIEYVHKIDSIYLHDSISTQITLKGDTIFIEKYKLYIKSVYKIDTIHKIDSIPKIIETKITKTVLVNKLYLWLKMLMYVGGVGILVLLGFIIYKFKIWKLLF